MRKAVTFVSLLVVLLCAGPALAQRTTGNIVGTITDATGSVLPGATIELSGTAIMGMQTTVSNDQGFYRFIALPPGEYNVTFTMPGFTTLKRERVKVSVGGTLEENVSLGLSQLQEEVTVVGETAVVDTASSEVSTNYDRDWVRNAPIPRFTFFDLINVAPGVSQSTSASSRSSSFGSGTDENSYQLDGSDFTAPFTGAAWPWPNTDAIEEIEILSLGAPAEYGNVSGAVFNVVTRQGSNEWHGDFNYYSQYNSLTDANTTDAEDGGLPFNRNKYQDFTVQLSGPVIKDQLWVLGSYQYQRDWQAQPGVDPNFPARQENDRIFFKLNWQPSTKHKFMFALHNDYYFLPLEQSANLAPSTVGVESGDNPSPNLTYTGVLSDKTFVEVRFSGFFGNDHSDPLNEGFPRVNPRFYDLDTGQVTGGTYYWYDNNVFREGGALKLSHFADDFLGGSHDFRFGVQYSRGGVENGRYGANDLIYVYDSYGTSYAYGYAYDPISYGGIATTWGVFFDDTFRVNDRLTLNLGLRYDYSRASVPELVAIDPAQEVQIADSQGGGDLAGERIPEVSNLFDWSNAFAPRLGFNYKLTADGKTVLKAHWGRYYRLMVAGEFSGSLGTSPADTIFGAYDLGSNSFVDPVVFSSSRNAGVSPSYEAPYTDQFVVGLERELARNVGLSLNYTKKWGRNFPAWFDIAGEYAAATYVDDQGTEATGRPIGVFALLTDPEARFFEIRNSDRVKTDIDAFNVQLIKRMADNWQFTGSFTYLRARGTLPSGRSGVEAGEITSLVFSDFGQNPNDFVNTGGRLSSERPVTVKAQLVYELPAGFLVGLNYTFQDGRPWSREVRVPDLGITTTINAEERDGERRLPRWNLLDLRLQKQFTFPGNASFAVFADALNLLNDDFTEGVVTQLGTSEGFGVPTIFTAPRRLMVGAKLSF